MLYKYALYAGIFCCSGGFFLFSVNSLKIFSPGDQFRQVQSYSLQNVFFQTKTKEVIDMRPPLERQEAERLVETYSDLVLRLSYSYLNQTQDAQDICQTVFLKLLERAPDFVSSDHEKAWIIRTTANTCKDLLKSHWRRTTVAMEAASHIPAPELEEGSLSAAVNLLPPKYRAVIYLYYYEGYSSKEIARLLGRNPATVATQLRRGRTQLKDLLESEGSS